MRTPMILTARLGIAAIGCLALIASCGPDQQSQAPAQVEREAGAEAQVDYSGWNGTATDALGWSWGTQGHPEIQCWDTGEPKGQKPTEVIGRGEQLPAGRGQAHAPWPLGSAQDWKGEITHPVDLDIGAVRVGVDTGGVRDGQNGPISGLIDPPLTSKPAANDTGLCGSNAGPVGEPYFFHPDTEECLNLAGKASVDVLALGRCGADSLIALPATDANSFLLAQQTKASAGTTAVERKCLTLTTTGGSASNTNMKVGFSSCDPGDANQSLAWKGERVYQADNVEVCLNRLAFGKESRVGAAACDRPSSIASGARQTFILGPEGMFRSIDSPQMCPMVSPIGMDYGRCPPLGGGWYFWRRGAEGQVFAPSDKSNCLTYSPYVVPNTHWTVTKSWCSGRDGNPDDKYKKELQTWDFAGENIKTGGTPDVRCMKTVAENSQDANVLAECDGSSEQKVHWDSTIAWDNFLNGFSSTYFLRNTTPKKTPGSQDLTLDSAGSLRLEDPKGSGSLLAAALAKSGYTVGGKVPADSLQLNGLKCGAASETVVGCRVARAAVNGLQNIGAVGYSLWTLPVRITVKNQTSSDQGDFVFVLSGRPVAGQGDPAAVGATTVNAMPTTEERRVISADGGVGDRSGSVGFLRVFDMADGGGGMSLTGKPYDMAEQDGDGNSGANVKERPFEIGLTMKVVDIEGMRSVYTKAGVFTPQQWDGADAQRTAVMQCADNAPDPRIAGNADLKSQWLENCGEQGLKVTPGDPASGDPQPGMMASDYLRVTTKGQVQTGPAKDAGICAANVVVLNSGDNARSLNAGGFIDLEIGMTSLRSGESQDRCATEPDTARWR